jgi:Cd2+/Zn2+-exporting ATPase/Cu+-exporting ATPase
MMAKSEDNLEKPQEDTLEVPIAGMDCADCTRHVRQAIQTVPGVRSVEVYLGGEKAIIHFDGKPPSMANISQAVLNAGYQVSEIETPSAAELTRPLGWFIGSIFAVVILVVVAGEWLGLFEWFNRVIPWPIAAGLILVSGLGIFRSVLRAALRRQIISHTLMTVGVIAAAVVGEWATALVVVFFMRVGDYVESYTAGQARRAIKDLSTLAPRTARLERAGQELEVRIEQVQPGDIVVVRPGEKIPVDGQVLTGQATIDQATLTGEPVPVDARPGSYVYAATIAQLGGLRIQADKIDQDSAFGQIITLVEQAEANKARLEQMADRFSAAYLPIVGAIALFTFLISRDPLATAAVLVVACSCSFALATPIAMLASIGASAKRGLLIKGGRMIEALASADVLLIDKTGTLTLGQPKLVDIYTLDHFQSQEVLLLAASAERYSEHPLAEAIRQAAAERGLQLSEPQDFIASPGLGISARVGTQQVLVSRPEAGIEMPDPRLDEWQAQGRTLIKVVINGRLAAFLAIEDTPRPEIPQSLLAMRHMGIEHIQLLTGDNAGSAAAVAEPLGLAYQADLLPEDKIEIVEQFQAQGHRVIMVGDGVNDAPALAQAHIGIAIGAAGSDIAVEVADIALLRDDWRLVPEAQRVAQRTMGVVKLNLGFTVLYNLIGLSLAALGFLPPVWAAAAQSLPDIGILANSSRLLYQGQPKD